MPTFAPEANQELADAEWSEMVENAFDEADDSRVTEYQQAKQAPGEVDDDDELPWGLEEEIVAQGATDGSSVVDMAGTDSFNDDELQAPLAWTKTGPRK